MVALHALGVITWTASNAWRESISTGVCSLDHTINFVKCLGGINKHPNLYCQHWQGGWGALFIMLMQLIVLQWPAYLLLMCEVECHWFMMRATPGVIQSLRIPWNLSFSYISFHEKRLHAMLWHRNARVNSHQRWEQMRLNECDGMTSFLEFMSLCKNPG